MPTEQIGFQAVEEHVSRMSSPRPQSSYQLGSDTPADSPLRQETFPTDGTGKSEFESTLPRGLRGPDVAYSESEVEDEDTIHVDPEEKLSHKIYSNASRYDSADSLGQYGDEEYSAPILASDEVAKEPFGWELHPAVSPIHERRSSIVDESSLHYRSGSASSLPGSRPTSRPASIHGNSTGLLVESTPLEDLEEYEPLFPEDEKSEGPSRPLTAADRLKRPELKVSHLRKSGYFKAKYT
jgi:hypothetical protein